MNIDECVRRLKAAYVDLRRRWRPQYRGTGPADDPLWLEVATVLLQGGQAEPENYVRHCFNIWEAAQADVYPAQVTSAKVATDYLSHRRTRVSILQLLVRLQADAVQCRLKRGETLRDILTDPLADLGPVFRYAAACDGGLQDLADLFREPAKEAVRYEPYYLDLLGKWLPKEEMRGDYGEPQGARPQDDRRPGPAAGDPPPAKRARPDRRPGG